MLAITHGPSLVRLNGIRTYEQSEIFALTGMSCEPEVCQVSFGVLYMVVLNTQD